MLHKEGKDPTSCEGYRPVSLLCNDLKILTNILAQRMQQHITKLIKPDQTGFIPGRQGANNIRRTLNLISCAKNNLQLTMLLTIAMMLSGDCPVELKEKVHFRWTEKGFRYLDIIITPSTEQLFEANYRKLITEIKNDLARWLDH